MADLLAHVYPGAEFICLYRHCMDVIVSAIDASPWGLSGYGFDSYVARTPGNMVLAVAGCWLEQTKAIIEFQERYPDRCHGVRYEDLVTTPEQIAGQLFTFLGLDPAPGITQTCLGQEHEIRGPADHKIWFTNRISTASLGQGFRVPLQMLPPEFVKNLNQTLDQLGYRQVDEDWRAAPGPADPRADGVPDAASGEPADIALDAAADQIASRLGSVPEDRLRDLARRWPATAGRNLVIAVQPPNGTGPRHCWTVSCADSVLTVRRGETAADATTAILASPATWQVLLKGQANFAAEARAWQAAVPGYPCRAAGPRNDRSPGRGALGRAPAWPGREQPVTKRKPAAKHADIRRTKGQVNWKGRSMKKAKTAMVILSAAAAANLATVGFAASPADASTHLSPATTVKAGRAPGFVPRRSAVPQRPSSTVVPDTETGCSSSGVVCLGLYGGGNHVSYVNESWTRGTGCHIGHIDVYYSSAMEYFVSGYTDPGYTCRNQEFTIYPRHSFYGTGTVFCGSFNNIPGIMCEEVR